MCKKFEIYVENMSTDEDEKAFWDAVIEFADSHGFNAFGVSSPWDKNVEEVENVSENSA